MARTAFIAGNWKMNPARAADAVDLALAVARGAKSAAADVGVAPPFVFLEQVRTALAGSDVRLGAQDCYFESSGAFTGEVSADMLRDAGVTFCLAGHSERRHVIGEAGELVAKKSAAIYAGGMTVVHCVGEKIEQRDAGQTLTVVERQLAEIDAKKVDDPNRLVVAYEPVWAIGTGRNATEQQAQEVHAFIRQNLAKRWSQDFADRVRILYGGSAKPENVAGLAAQRDVDGGLVGGASLKADLFLSIVDTVAATKAS